MTTEGHPGPWRSYDDGQVVDVRGLTVLHQGGLIGSDIADAALAAEAPTMYEMLEKLYKESGCDGDLCAHSWHFEFRELRARLAEWRTIREV